MKLNIGLDLEGVVADYQAVLINEFNKRHKTNYQVNDIKTYALENLGGTEEEIGQIVRKHEKQGIYRHLNPINGAVIGIRQLAKHNYIHIMTWRRNEAREDTIHWLDKYEIPFDSISFTKQKGSLAKQVGLDVCIDDTVEYIKDINSHGVKAIIFDRPWNQNYKSVHSTRIKGWTNLVNHLEGYRI